MTDSDAQVAKFCPLRRDYPAAGPAAANADQRCPSSAPHHLTANEFSLCGWSDLRAVAHRAPPPNRVDCG